MASNRFYISIILYCVLIFGSAFLFYYFLQFRQQPSTAAGIAIFSLLVCIRLIYYVNRTNRILGNFLSYMQESDPSLQFSVRYVKRHFKGLHESMELLIGELKENRISLEVQAHYLETILDNVSTGILCFDDRGKIRTINRAAGALLNLTVLEDLDELERYHPGLGKDLLKMRSASEATLTVLHEGKQIRLAIHSSLIRLREERIHIIALNDISRQMEEQEILSWKKLIRVINHEIMNSMTPIITLSMAIRRKLGKGNEFKPADQISGEARSDAVQSASIIEERSKGLVQFIERYKKLTSLPPMNRKPFMAGTLFVKIEQLFREDLKGRGIRMIWPESCLAEIEGDLQMLEQVFINLVKNSMEALHEQEDPEIELSCERKTTGQVCLTVRDNGEGIPKDKQEQIFVPFFTTRREGSGIGLSLCKQIIASHGGTIHVDSRPGQGTRVDIFLNLEE